MGAALKLNLNQKPLAPAAAFDLLMGGDKAAMHIVMLPVDKLQSYPNQPFRPYNNEKLQELANDIAANGIHSPVIVRPNEKDYQILAGHNRTNAASLAGLSEVPCIVKEDCDDETAALIVVNTNLNQREELLPSEKAFAYKMQLSAMKRQAGRPKNNSGQLGRNLNDTESRDVLALQSGESSRQISRYIRLTYLLPEILEMVDDKVMPFMAGVNLSYITPDEQQLLLSFITDHEVKTVSLKHSETIKVTPELTENALMEIFGLITKPKNVKGKSGIATRKVLDSYFKDSIYEDEEIAKILDNALNKYFSKNE